MMARIVKTFVGFVAAIAVLSACTQTSAPPSSSVAAPAFVAGGTVTQRLVGTWANLDPQLPGNQSSTAATSFLSPDAQCYDSGTKSLIPTLDVAKAKQIMTASGDRKSTRLNSSHVSESRMPSSA